jgi:uncharacterized C2H2 Zn-finger protein
MFSCTHCGFVTQYEVEYNNHVKIHYLWDNFISEK